MKKLIGFTFILLFLLVNNFSLLTAQERKVNLDEKIKNDPKVITGKLANGITYYIRPNKKPENRAELRLAVNAGSILEDDDQQGLAHFCEHMAFNGTKNFKKQDIVNFLEGIGMRFGPELNAYTSFDETVYMLQIPTDKKDILEKGFQVLGDWACNISFENEEIDKERGVIVEEWRLGRGAYARIRDIQFPVTLKDSRYAERLPIGKKEIIESFKYETLKKFYKDWYRPDLMAVVAIGDFEVKDIENYINKYFSSIPAAANPRERKVFEIPKFKETLYTIASDKELSMSTANVLYKQDTYSTVTLKDARIDELSSLLSSIMSERIDDILLQPNCPFIMAAIYAGGRYVRTLSNAAAYVYPKEGQTEAALKAVLVELERAKKFGFTQTELDRAKKARLRNFENLLKEKDKRESAYYVSRIIENFTVGETYPDEETQYEQTKLLLPTITLQDINAFINEKFKEENRVAAISLVEKAGLVKPTPESIAKILADAPKEKMEPFVDKALNEDLITFSITPGKIVSEKKDDRYGITELTLSNGAKVVLKPTDFKNEQVLYTSFSDGGTSLCDDKDYLSASMSSSLVSSSGAGKFTQPQLNKYLSGKIAYIYPSIGNYSEGLSGQTSLKDLEDFFKLNYLYFTQPRKDSSSYKAMLAQYETQLLNKSSNPEYVFSDTVSVTLGNYHKRRLPIDADKLKQIDYNTAYKFYKERFADASDFTFIFVGSFDLQTIKPYIEKYIASLPSLNRNDKWKDLGIRYPKGSIIKEIKKGIEPKSRVQMFYTGDFDWTKQEALKLQNLTDALNIKLREVIREEKGGTYGISIYSSASKIPTGSYMVGIGWGCKPERAEELSKEALTQIDSVINYPMKEIYINKIKETLQKSLEKNLKDNNYWLSWLRSSYSENVDLSETLNVQDRLKDMTAQTLQETAKKFFNKNNFIKVTLYPEK